MPVQVAGLIERLFIYVLPIAVLFPLLRSTPLAYRFALISHLPLVHPGAQVERDIDRFTRQELDDEIDYLAELDRRLADGVRVPVFYQRDFYDLRMHLRLVLDRPNSGLTGRRRRRSPSERPRQTAGGCTTKPHWMM
ncbi:MAG: hypothetical protein R2838_02210 [Caldilineaceae bacterium]